MDYFLLVFHWHSNVEGWFQNMGIVEAPTCVENILDKKTLVKSNIFDKKVSSSTSYKKNNRCILAKFFR